MERYATIERIIMDSGVWNEGRRDRYGFILTPETYQLSRDEVGQLEEIGHALVPVMKGIGRIVATADNFAIAKGKAWDTIRRIVQIGIPRSQRRLQTLFPDAYPLTFKIDLLRSNGKLRIVELDGTNTHGLGYNVLLNGIRDALVSEHVPRLKGVPAVIAEYVKRHHPGTPLFCFIGGNSRFYDPYYRLFSRDLEKRGVPTIYSREWMNGHESHFESTIRAALHFPLFRNDSPLETILAQQYAQGLLEFLVPPKPYLRSKSVFALLKNSAQTPELEHILLSEIDGTALDTLRGYIPETYLIYPESVPQVADAIKKQTWVQKQAISSGMKGTEFVGRNEINVGLIADRKPYQTILQEELENDPMRFTYYDTDELKSDTWYCRFTAQYCFSELIEVDITARRDKIIHGATDCIMMSTILP